MSVTVLINTGSLSWDRRLLTISDCRVAAMKSRDGNCRHLSITVAGGLSLMSGKHEQAHR